MDTRTSNVPVCRFQHFRIGDAGKVKSFLPLGGKKTGGAAVQSANIGVDR